MTHNLLILLPALLVLAGLLARFGHFQPQTTNQIAQASVLISTLVAIFCLTLWISNSMTGGLPDIRVNALVFTMLLLSNFIGWVVLRFSLSYMAGEGDLNRFYSLILQALAAISVVIMSNHMLTLLAAWMTISITLHRLLKFYPERPRAALAAHKKFLFARLAEISMLTAVILLYIEHQTFFIDQMLIRLDVEQLTWREEFAAALFAVAALVKCAQMPMHGWLTQVVEAPTPVSALLHAGIINIGGFLLLVYAPLIAASTLALVLLAIFAGLTTLTAALIMTTRVSIKVRLAWSTMAQMGLMLIEIALGLYHLALLHLVAHSLYKAHAFLNSGNAVVDNVYQQLAPRQQPQFYQWLLALSIALPLGWLGYWYFGADLAWSPWLLLACALTFLLAEQQALWTLRRIRRSFLLLLAIAASYITLKLGAETLSVKPQGAPMALDIWVGMLISLLCIGSWLLKYRRQNPAIKKLYGQLYAGFYLDEWVTKLTLKLFPVKLPKQMKASNIANNEI